MTDWKFTLTIPGPLVTQSIGNFPVGIQYLSSNTFKIVTGTLFLNENDLITITNSSINGTYTVGSGVTFNTIPVTPSISFFTGTENVFIEVTRPVATWQTTDIEEPVGFNEIVFNVQRDERWHGVFFEASTSQLGFYGEGYDIVKEQKDSYGVDAVVIFSALAKCEGETEYEEAITGKLNFSKYQETCGRECIARLFVEQGTCAMTFKNRFDQKVDIDTPIAFDKQTNLVQYDGLNMTMELATQIIPISSDGEVSLGGDPLSLANQTFYLDHQNLLFRPVYSRVNDNSIMTGKLEDPENVWQDPDNTFYLTPQLLLEDNAKCINDAFTYEIRLKGTLDPQLISSVGTVGTMSLWAVVDYWDGVGSHTGPGNLTGNATELHRVLIGTVISDPKVFDETFNGTVSLPVGSGLYAYMKLYYSAGIGDSEVWDFTINFEPDTSFLLYTERSCPPTDAQVNLVHELLARTTESITDRCLTIYSEYYGRTDSEPYSYAVDGCGSLRVLTTGLKVRQALDKNSFMSMKELMEGLRAIDNIGMGMETDRVRIEPAEWFYQNTKVLDIDLVPQSRSEINDQLTYSNLKTGYSKWEIKSIKGIDEFNSAKEYRTGLKSVNNELIIRSDLIASGYIIENLRTSTLAGTGQTDNTYDNDIFIICVDRDAYGYHVEQGIAENAANFYSPATAYNWRIRPIYNLMRWFKSIAQSYVNLVNTTSKLFFTSGTGNYLAEGEISIYDTCRLESKVIPENEDLDIGDFQDVSQGTPIYKPESVTFDYPLSIRDYKLIKATPYGYLNVQCGTGEFFKAYIKQIEYKVAEGQAQFTLIRSWL